VIVTVDGPAGAGKSTVARALADRLGFTYLDTGAMYRAVTWRAMHCQADLENREELARVAREADIRLEPGEDGMRVLCDGRDVTGEIRTPEVTDNIWRMADEPAVRRVLIDMQRQYGREHDIVTEGRDQGTDVFPDADVKFYLDASVEERARRRAEDLADMGRNMPLREVRRQVMERDQKDRSRPMGALRRTDDMIVVDSTDMGVAQIVQAMAAQIRRRGDQVS
jgi:cytidylate kinase